MRPDVVAGAVFPDYELPDHTGARRELSHLQQSDPMAWKRGEKRRFFPYGRSLAEVFRDQG